MAKRTSVPAFSAALRLRCPKCGKGKLFKSFLKTVDRCAVCGLPIKEYDAADGPAYASMTVIGMITVVAAIAVEAIYAPAFWVHAVLWIPFVLVGSLISLVFFTALFIALHYAVRWKKE